MTKTNMDLVKSFDAEEYFKHTKVNEHDISTDMSEIADQIAFYGFQEGLWETAVGYAKAELDALWSLTFLEAKRSGDKTISTDKGAEAKADSDEEVIKLRKKILKLEEQRRAYKSAVFALDIKSKQMQSKNASKRQEQGHYYSGGTASPSMLPGGGYVGGGYVSASKLSNSSDAAKEKLNSLLSGIAAKKPLASDDVPF